MDSGLVNSLPRGIESSGLFHRLAIFIMGLVHNEEHPMGPKCRRDDLVIRIDNLIDDAKCVDTVRNV